MKKSRYRVGIWLTGFISTLFLAVSVKAANQTVTSTADAGGSCPGANCTLRQAIATAGGGDTINFSLPANSVISLTSAELLIIKGLTITGPGANLLTVQRSATAGIPDLRIFHVVGKFNATFSGLTIRAGNLTTNDIGGGIYNEGANVTARDCTIADNVVGFGGAGVNNRADGQSSTVQLFNCTVSNNTGKASAGGIINLAANGGNATMSLVNCTVSGNTGAALAGGIGNGISNGGTASLSIFNCTFSGNTPGTLYVGGTTEMGNTILKRGASGANIVGTITSRGHNLSDDAAGGDASTGPGGTLNATGDQRNTDPRLGPLQNNGGPTFTHNLLANSPARDAGDDAVLGPPLNLTTDQRGFPRRVDLPGLNDGGDSTDIGAVEAGLVQTGPTFTVTNTAEHDDGTCSTDDCTLIEALNATNANPDANIINFTPGLTGAIGTANLTPIGLTISNPVTINGPGSRVLTVTGRTSARVFRVLSANVNISGLSIVNGKATNDQGGAISNTGGLTLTECTITNSAVTGTTTTTGNGGGIYNAAGASLTLTRCTLNDNSAQEFGGGLYNDGTFTATNCTFSNNTALRGGGIISRFANGASSSLLRNCTITKCSATDGLSTAGSGGGGFYAEGGAQQHHVGNTIIAFNTSTNDRDVRGNITSDGHNFIGNVGDSAGFMLGSPNGDQGAIGGTGTADPKLDATLKNNGGPTDTHALTSTSTAINAGDDALAPPTDQRGYLRNGRSDIGAFEFGGLIPSSLANISTRLRVETGDNVLIVGFIVTGTQPKKIIVRAIGPSLPFADKLADPILELHDSSGALLETNDNWMDSPNKQAIIDSTIPPNDPLESAIVRSVAPGNYTAIERGVNNGTGTGVVEAYDLDTSANSKLANVATRGLVQTGDNVLFAGVIVVGQASQKVIIRALGPSTGVPGAMADPTLELHDVNGALLEANDNWVDSPNKQAIIDSTIPPPNNAESAIVRILTPANYTAIVRGANNSTGIAVVEVYALN
jgi:CSLREA domain-containing protein